MGQIILSCCKIDKTFSQFCQFAQSGVISLGIRLLFVMIIPFIRAVFGVGLLFPRDGSKGEQGRFGGQG